jgi:restriction system protein
MVEMTQRRLGELVRGVFQILLDEPDGLPVREVMRRLESLVPPSDFERSAYPKRPGVRRYEKTVRFATITAVKADEG